MFRKLFPALLLALAACAPHARPIASAPPPVVTEPAKKPVWAFEQSDLVPDPAFRFGRLDNGMRYIVRHNATPLGQGEVRLYVDAGSTSETEAERGYAHFLEHMAFNGSNHVPEGDMVKLLEREGLAFGADTNATTSFNFTLYKLNLPRNDPKLLDTALMLMRETASELSLAPSAIDSERGVVLSEKRERDTFALRNLMDRLGFLYPDAHFVERLPIGTAQALNAATTDGLRGLYSRIYKPENTTLTVVGDFDPDQVEKDIRLHFADWKATPASPKPSEGPVDAARADKTALYIDPALSERITISRNGPWLDEKDTVQNRRTGLLRQIGYGAINRRLERLANAEHPPFRGAGLGTSDVFKVGRTTNLVIDTGDGEWREGMTAAAVEYRRAMAFGLTRAEIDEQLASIRTELENAAAGADTRNNATFTAAAIALVQDDRVPTTPKSSLERFEELAPTITPESVMEALRGEAIPLERPLIRFEGRTTPTGGAAALRKAWNRAIRRPVDPPSSAAVAQFAYSDFGSPGTVLSDRTDPRLGIRELRFANGLKLNLKRTDLKLDRIWYELNIDGGDMLDTRNNPLATAMVSLLPQGGLGKHSYDDLQSILAGRSVSFSLDSAADTFAMNGVTTPRDLSLQLQLLAAGITDPGYRSQGEAQYHRNVTNFFASKDATPSSALNNALGGIISDGDPRFTLQSKEDYLALNFAKLRADIADRLAHGAMELALVGDFDEGKAIDLVARTLGALPPREAEFRPYADNRQRSFTADRSPRAINHLGQADQALLRFSWPTRDDSDALESTKLALLERVLRVELTDNLREKLGKTYSPSVNASQSRQYRGYGTFNIAASIDVHDVDLTRQAIDATLRDLLAKPVDEDTLLRARKPMAEQIENMLKTNDGWMSLVDRAQSEPDYIDRYLQALDRLNRLTAEDLREVAIRYLDPAKRLEILVLPRPAKVPGEE